MRKFGSPEKRSRSAATIEKTVKMVWFQPLFLGETMIFSFAPWHLCVRSSFLQSIQVLQFFGSWFFWQGQSQTCDFLGCKVVEALQRQMALPDLALLDNSETHLRPILERMAKRG